MIKRLIGTAFGVTAGLALAFAPAAGAAVASNTPVATHYSESLAGYAGADNGLTAIAAAEGTVTMPNEPNDTTAIQDEVAVGIVLQESEGGGSTPTVGEGYVWDDNTINTVANVCQDGGAISDQWVLEYGVTNAPPGVPLPPASLHPITFGTNGTSQKLLNCVTPGSPAFLEVYYSTRANRMTLLDGTEPGDIALDNIHPSWTPGTMLHEFGFGVDTSSGPVASDLAQGHLASFTRDGLTVLASPVVGAHSIQRVEMDSLNINEYIGTQDGSSSGASTLLPSGLAGAVGAAFTVTAQG